MKSDRPSKVDYRSRKRLKKKKQRITSYPPKQKSGQKYSGTEKRLTDCEQLFPGVLVSWVSIFEHSICFLLDALSAATSL